MCFLQQHLLIAAVMVIYVWLAVVQWTILVQMELLKCATLEYGVQCVQSTDTGTGQMPMLPADSWDMRGKVSSLPNKVQASLYGIATMHLHV